MTSLLSRLQALKVRTWYFNPVAKYRCEVNEGGIGLTGNEVKVTERDLLPALKIAAEALEIYANEDEWTINAIENGSNSHGYDRAAKEALSAIALELDKLEDKIQKS